MATILNVNYYILICDLGAITFFNRPICVKQKKLLQLSNLDSREMQPRFLRIHVYRSLSFAVGEWNSGSLFTWWRSYGVVFKASNSQTRQKNLWVRLPESRSFRFNVSAQVVQTQCFLFADLTMTINNKFNSLRQTQWTQWAQWSKTW